MTGFYLTGLGRFLDIILRFRDGSLNSDHSKSLLNELLFGSEYKISLLNTMISISYEGLVIKLEEPLKLMFTPLKKINFGEGGTIYYRERKICYNKCGDKFG